MSDYSKDIERRFNNFSDEELIRVIEVNKGEYTEEALSIARAVIEKRGGIERLKENVEKALREGIEQVVDMKVRRGGLDMNLFTMHGRINRARYIGHTLSLPLLLILLFGITVLGDLLLLEYTARFLSIIGVALLGVFVIPYGVLHIFSTVRRFHDLNQSGANYWLLFVPFYDIYLSLILLFQKGTDGPNQYGDDPLSTFNTEHTVIKLEKEYISFRQPNDKEQIMIKGSISVYELDDHYNLEGLDSSGTIVSQDIPRKSLGIRSKYFLRRLTEYMAD